MSGKKVIALILGLGAASIIGGYLITYHIFYKTDKDIKVMEYIAPTITCKNAYQIDKYENIEIKEWLDENQVLILGKKVDSKNNDEAINTRFCSVYNLNTKESKEFQDVNIDELIGVSPDKKYVLYSEPIINHIAYKNGDNVNEELKKAHDPENLFHKNVKVLNLFTGEITDINTENNNSFAEFEWVGNNKILENFISGIWKITDISGEVYLEGSYNKDSQEPVKIAGTDDIRDLENGIEGKFYYTQDFFGEKGEGISTKLCTIDVKTKGIKNLRTIKNSLGAAKKGKTIVMNNYNVKIHDGRVIVCQISGKTILDESGKTTSNIDLPKGIYHSDYILSPDGSKAAYLEGSYVAKKDITVDTYKGDEEVSLKVLDIKTGEVKELVKSSSLGEEMEYNNKNEDCSNSKKKYNVNKSITNICWDNQGVDLSFSYGDSKHNDKINSYIVSFDK